MKTSAIQHSSFTLHHFLTRFDLFADAPDAVAKVRELVRQLAVQGRLVGQSTSDESARVLSAKIAEDLRQHSRNQTAGKAPALWYHRMVFKQPMENRRHERVCSTARDGYHGRFALPGPGDLSRTPSD